MKTLIYGCTLAVALTSTSAMAQTALALDPALTFQPSQGEQIWLAQGNSGNAKGGKKILKKPGGKPGNGKPEHAGGPKPKANGKPEHAGGPKPKATGKPEHAGAVKPKARDTDRAAAASGSDILATPAPDGRDMVRVLSGTALALATPQMVLSDIPEDELIAYSNCPPGLAKKDPPCVPPGLAKKGVTYEEWASYDQEDYDTLWNERREAWLDAERDFDPDAAFLLNSDQIATLFDLEPAPAGQRYALIDGLPVLLDEEDYTSLMLVNEIAQVAELSSGVSIAPTAALTQQELIDLYRLPQLGADQNYTVVNGQILQMNDAEYEILQLIRIARAVL